MSILQQLFESSLSGRNHSKPSLATFSLNETGKVVFELTSTFLSCKVNKHLLLASTGAGTACVFDMNVTPEEFYLVKQIKLGRTIDEINWFRDESKILFPTKNNGGFSLVDVETSHFENFQPSRSEIINHLFPVKESPNLISWSSVQGSFGISDVRTSETVFTKRNVHKLPKIQTQTISSIVSINDNGNIYVCTAGGMDGSIKIWDIRKSDVELCSEITRSNEQSFKGQGISSMDLDQSGRRLISARNNQQVSIHNLKQLKQVNKSCRTFKVIDSDVVHTNRVRVKISPDGSQLAMINNSYQIIAFSSESVDEALELRIDGSTLFAACDWTEDGSLVGCSVEGEVVRWGPKCWGIKRQRMFERLKVVEM